MEILVDRDGYEQFMDVFEKLKNSMNNIATFGSEEYRNAVGDGWHDNFAYEELMRDEKKVSAQIEKMLGEKKHLKVIDNTLKKDELINIGDILKIEVIYDESDVEVFEIKLTGKYLPDLESDIQEISLNSQMGKALFKKNIYKDISYKIHGNLAIIKVLEKNGKIVN